MSMTKLKDSISEAVRNIKNYQERINDLEKNEKVLICSYRNTAYHYCIIDTDKVKDVIIKNLEEMIEKNKEIVKKSSLDLLVEISK